MLFAYRKHSNGLTDVQKNRKTKQATEKSQNFMSMFIFEWFEKPKQSIIWLEFRYFWSQYIVWFVSDFASPMLIVFSLFLYEMLYTSHFSITGINLELIRSVFSSPSSPFYPEITFLPIWFLVKPPHAIFQTRGYFLLCGWRVSLWGISRSLVHCLFYVWSLG